jgi:hypothetical protein
MHFNMKKIGVGIFCFGDEHYFKGTVNKINNLFDYNFKTYILTDNVEFFEKKYTPFYLTVIPYKRNIKSYHDKIVLVKHILDENDVAIIIDADTDIKDFKIFEKIKNYNFKEGISYIETLESHPTNKKYIKEINMKQDEWREYHSYSKSVLKNFDEKETIWEYFLIFNKTKFNQDKFFLEYEKLQIVKENCDISYNKNVLGPGEGISIQTSSTLSNTPIVRDDELHGMIKDNIIGISKRHTKPSFWPNWMR